MTASKSSRARNARAAAQAGARSGAARNGASGGTAVKNRDQARNGAAARGPRTIEVRDEPEERGPAPWMQIATFVLALAGLTWSQIAADLSNPNSTVAKAVDGTANNFTAAICKMTGNQPASACTSTIQSLESSL